MASEQTVATPAMMLNVLMVCAVSPPKSIEDMATFPRAATKSYQKR